jgi:excisionase family DNA binding protein
MSDPAKSRDDRLLVTLSVSELRDLIRAEVATAKSGRESKLLYTTKEAAAMLNIEESWLAAKARAGEIPHRMLGHYRYFSMDDIDAIIQQSAPKPKLNNLKKKPKMQQPGKASSSV